MEKMELLRLFAENGGFSGLVTAVLLLFFLRIFNRMVNSNERHAEAAIKVADSIGELKDVLLEGFHEIKKEVTESKEEIIGHIRDGNPTNQNKD